MNKLIISLVVLLASSSISAKSVNVGVGGVIRNTSVIALNHDGNDFKNTDKGRLAGRVNVHALCNMFGLRVSADAGNDEKHILNDSKGPILTSNSNFTMRIAPLVQYKENKIAFNSSIGPVYKHLKIISHHETNPGNNGIDLNAESNHHFGIGGHVGVSYAVKSVTIFSELNSDFMFKKKNHWHHDESAKFTTNSDFDFGICFGVSAQLIG